MTNIGGLNFHNDKIGCWNNSLIITKLDVHFNDTTDQIWMVNQPPNTTYIIALDDDIDVTKMTTLDGWMNPKQ